MKKIHVLTICSYFFLGAGVLLAGQIILFNKTGRPVDFSVKFFHNEAEQKMVVGDFKLQPREKTHFPQEKDREIAKPLKINVRWPNNRLSTTSKKFDREDAKVHNLEILERAGRLRLQEKS